MQNYCLSTYWNQILLQLGAIAGYGIWWAKDHELNQSERADRQTNNAAEIQAVTETIKLAKHHDMKALLIHTDSNFLIDCVTKVIRSKSMLSFYHWDHLLLIKWIRASKVEMRIMYTVQNFFLLIPVIKELKCKLKDPTARFWIACYCFALLKKSDHLVSSLTWLHDSMFSGSVVLASATGLQTC